MFRQVIAVPPGVTITIHEKELEVKGPKGTLKSPISPGISCKIEDGELKLVRENESFKAVHGLTRALVNNSVVGVTQGFTKDMDLVGVGYKAEVKGNVLAFSLGYSHPIEYPLPTGIEAKTERIQSKTSINQYQLTLTLSGIDKQKLGQVAAELNGLRKPDPYKGKGIRYADRVYRLKPGKTGK